MARDAAHTSAGMDEQVLVHNQSEDWYVCNLVNSIFGNFETIIFYQDLNFCYSGRVELVSNLLMWWYPPQVRQQHSTSPTSPDPYFLLPFFLWAPQKVWAVKRLCNEECRAKQNEQPGTKVCIA